MLKQLFPGAGFGYGPRGPSKQAKSSHTITGKIILTYISSPSAAGVKNAQLGQKNVDSEPRRLRFGIGHFEAVAIQVQ